MTRTPHRALLSRAVLVRTGAVVATVVLAGCGQDAPTAALTPTPASSGASAPAAAGPGTPVLRVEDVGGFTTASTSLARLPAVSVYADGRVITEVLPDPASSDGPPPALPSLVVHDVGPDGAARLVRLARDAGVGTDALLGRPGIADATTTRFTVVIDGAVTTTEAYALRESAGSLSGLEQDGGPVPDAGILGDGLAGDLTAAQVGTRQDLVDLRGALTDVGSTLGGDAGAPAPYQPSALAVLAVPLAPGTGGEQPAPWPGPALPGEPVGASEATCVVAQGAALGRALTAAGDTDVTALWSSGGSSWTLTFRPLLPDERGCADLGG